MITSSAAPEITQSTLGRTSTSGLELQCLTGHHFPNPRKVTISSPENRGKHYESNKSFM